MRKSKCEHNVLDKLIRSQEAEDFITSLPPLSERPFPPKPDDIKAWQSFQQKSEQYGCQRSEQIINELSAISTDIPCKIEYLVDSVFVKPNQIKSPSRVIYLHGGAFTLFSARSSLFASIPLAIELGCELVAINYAKAPQFDFRHIVSDSADKVTKFINSKTILIGDSAGGGLAVSVIHELHKRARPLPRKLVLWSPWVDLTANDITIDDPVLRFNEDLEVSAQCYAPKALQKHPMASPLYAIYGIWFPETLIQMGSNEILGDSIRQLAKKMQIENVDCKLSIFQNMYHSFQSISPHIPEVKIAYEQIKQFIWH